MLARLSDVGPHFSVVGRLVITSYSIHYTKLYDGYSGVDPEANQMGRCGGGGEAGNAVQCNFLRNNFV